MKLHNILLYAIAIFYLTACNNGSSVNSPKLNSKFKPSTSSALNSLLGTPVFKLGNSSGIFIPNNYSSCLENPNSQLIQHGTIYHETHLNYFSSYYNVTKLLNAGADLSLKNDSVAASLLAELDSEEKANNKSLNLYVVSKVYQPIYFANPPKINSTDPIKCGTGYVSGVYAQISFVAIINLNFNSEMDVYRAQLALSAAGISDTVSISALMNLNKTFKGINYDISLELIQIGGEDTKIFSLFDGKEGGYDKNGSKLTLSNITPENMSDYIKSIVNYEASLFTQMNDESKKLGRTLEDVTTKFQLFYMQAKPYSGSTMKSPYLASYDEQLENADYEYQRLLKKVIDFNYYRKIFYQQIFVPYSTNYQLYVDEAVAALAVLENAYKQSISKLISQQSTIEVAQEFKELENSLKNVEHAYENINSTLYNYGYLMKNSPNEYMLPLPGGDDYISYTNAKNVYSAKYVPYSQFFTLPYEADPTYYYFELFNSGRGEEINDLSTILGAKEEYKLENMRFLKRNTDLYMKSENKEYKYQCLSFMPEAQENDCY